MLDTAVESAGAHSYTVDLLSSGRLSIEDNTDVVDIDWSSGTVDAAWFGFHAAATGSADSHLSDFPVGRIWFPEQETVDDSGTVPVYSTSRQRMADGSMDAQRWAKWYIRDVVIDALPIAKIREDDETLAQSAWSSSGGDRPSDWWADGTRFEYVPDRTARGTYVTMRPREDTEPTITPGTVYLYDLVLPMIAYVA